MATTKFADSPLSEYIIHAVAKDDLNYTYYFLVHPKGRVIVMREQESSSLDYYQYADGKYNLSNAYTNRATLDYKDYDKLE